MQRRSCQEEASGKIVAISRSWLGTPYCHQASLKGIGCDCLGLLRGIWREAMGDEPQAALPYTPDWAEAAGQDTLLMAAQRHLVEKPDRSIVPGDVLLFRWRTHLPAKHCAIATSATTMIHAHDGACVAEVTIPPFWRRKLTGLFAFPEYRFHGMKR